MEIEYARSRKPLDQMSPEELCEEASRLRTAISKSAERLGDLYGMLYSSVRRGSHVSTGEVYAYISVANAGKRLAGMIVQAVRRTNGVDKVLVTARADAEEAERQRLQKEREEKDREDREKRRLTAEKVDREFKERLFGYDPQVTQDDLIELYGEH